MAKPDYIELGPVKHSERIAILYEDRSVLALDKPPGWMLVPLSWEKTNRNLQAAIDLSVRERDYWARARNLTFLRNVHRLDADTSGVLLFAKSRGALHTYGDLFESRQMEKTYLVVVQGRPAAAEWTCSERLGQDPEMIGRMRVDPLAGKEAETHFRIVETTARTTLVEARPVTGRTHQIRVHLAHGGHPVVGDPLYGHATKAAAPSSRTPTLGLRAVRLSYVDPFTRRRVRIEAPTENFLRTFHFAPPAAAAVVAPK